MKHLISPAEAIDLAFSPAERQSRLAVTDAMIETAQLRFLKPALGGLYDALCAGRYAELLRAGIKPALAHYVRYQVLLHLAFEAGKRGAEQAAPFDDLALTRTRRDARRDARRTARLLLAELLGYVRARADEFPEFDRAGRRTEVIGGVVV